MIALHADQYDLQKWAFRNFGIQTSSQMLLGAMEELGELAHAHLKKEQEIRKNEDHDEKARDAVGDIIIYLMQYCSLRNWDIETVISDAVEAVLSRDWKINPIDGVKHGD